MTNLGLKNCGLQFQKCALLTLKRQKKLRLFPYSSNDQPTFILQNIQKEQKNHYYSLTQYRLIKVQNKVSDFRVKTKKNYIFHYK